ncbi:hypothetical protein P152DRAFT_513402 [Eremomyces bilateralis CBS 781.70]|uniref:Uncharacterized protein n=1 Tax=Eremomyces bilateralis CBS 781.70 TaxID=1392243 RepID=A0A6G1G7X6_9PEZI|nr:uncharacterized protein P152DRAFT_513402 [Eremomyces bilateralis CBS 781.70]KAF1814102.1 hypothetical protein P152DRAFT_513402 [Eremomyces bilateralis CBS 781.70]
MHSVPSGSEVVDAINATRSQNSRRLFQDTSLTMVPRRTIRKGEAGEQEAKERLASFQNKPLDDTVPVSDRTTYKRGYAMWLFKYSSPVEVALAQDTCRAFLQTYVSDSSVSGVALGDQEYEEVRQWIVHDLPFLTGISNALKRQKRATTAQDRVVIISQDRTRQRWRENERVRTNPNARKQTASGFHKACEPRARVCRGHFAMPTGLSCESHHWPRSSTACFRAGYTSFDQVLTRPNLRGCKVLFLPWAQGLDDFPFVDISGSQFYRIWYRWCEVAGMENPPIPYSMRVGSGGKIIRILGELLGHWMLMHKSNTQQEYYFPDYVSQNLARVMLGVLAPPEDALFSLLADLSSTADPFALCHLSEEEFKKLLERRDVQAL